MDCQAIAQDIARHLHLPPLRLDAQHACGLRFEDMQLDVVLSPQRELLCLTGVLGIAVASTRDELLGSLLLANLSLTENGRPHAAFDPDHGRVALCIALPFRQLREGWTTRLIDPFLHACRSTREQLAGQYLAG